MKDEDKSTQQLIDELIEMRQRVAALEASEKKHQREEETLLQRTSELRGIFQAFPDLYFRLGSDGTIVDYNAGRTSYLYIAPEAFLGKRMQDVLPPKIGRQFQEAISQVLKTKRMVSVVYELPMPTGEQSYEARLLPLLERQVVVVVRDISERRRSEEEIKKLNKDLELRAMELETINMELKAFNYSVSHDLRVPLLVIGGFSRKLLEKYSAQLDTKGQQFVDTIYRNTQNMQQLIDDLLTFSNLDNRKMKVSEVNMGELAKAVFEELRDLDPGRALVLKTLPQVYGDKAMIRQVFVNLLSNAFKFTRPKGSGVIEIGSMTEENKAVYYVRDNGIGFDMQDANKLFNVFQRLHSPDEVEGTGVGLAIVKRIIIRHGGWVWAEGRVNEGATFYFSLPMEKPAAPKKTKAPEEKTANET
ncbi:MAG: ATP-binding protein [Deltaproteobacteria bacterium]